MRILAIAGLMGLVAGCALFPRSPPSPTEMDEMAERGCRMWPDTDEWLECRRRANDYREPSYEGPRPVYRRGHE